MTSGLGVYVDAAAVVERFRLAESELCGVQLAAGGVADLHEGEVAGNPIGANVQTPGFDLARLQDRVLFVDNEINLDAAGLPVPGAGERPSELP
jgi:hypothetical protein